MVQSQTGEKSTRNLRRAESALLLPVEIPLDCPRRSKPLGHLLCRERHRVAELFESLDMVMLDTLAIPLAKVIRSQVGIGLFGA